MPEPRVAIADIGSNSARMVVMQRSGDAGLLPVAESKFALRLQREVQKNGEITDEGLSRLISILRDFESVAKSAGANEMVTVATSAVRNVTSQAELLSDVKSRTGLDLDVLSGQEEAEATFIGAISSLPVESGAVVDIGGGSMEIVVFENRSPIQTVTLPLGALRLSDRFLEPDEVSSGSIRNLSDHVAKVLTDKGVLEITQDGQVVGTGGTARNVAKLDRRRSKRRLGRLHGHLISLAGLDELTGQLSTLALKRRRNLPGLNPDRADSVIGGMVALRTATEFLSGDSLLVSGAGLREGLALKWFGIDNGRLARTARQSVHDMCVRFSTWDQDRAARRASIARHVCAAFCDSISEEIAEAICLAAEIVDAGSAIDYYQRYRSAGILTVSSNAGLLTHRQIALVSAICSAADRSSLDIPFFAGEIHKSESIVLQQAGVLLRIADEVEMRIREWDEELLQVERSGRRNRNVRLAFPGGSDWPTGSLHRHYRSVYRGLLESSDTA